MLQAFLLRKEFTSVVAVDGVSFEARRGEILGLLGPNGAGKTTSIRIVLNILQPDGGVITYDKKPFSEQLRNSFGYLPEERGLYRKSKLLDTILYFAELRGMKRTLAKTEAIRWLARFDLSRHAEQRVDELSKGNQQKVQCICSLIHDPDLVVLDEPFSGLDPVNQILFKEVLMELKQKGKAVIFSTHQLDQAEKLSDNLCLINKGKVVLDGPVRDVKRRYGRNSLHLEFEGDGSFLRSLPEVRSAIIYEHSAELELADGADIQALLPTIVHKLVMRKFELLEPSLESIFLQVVNEVDRGVHSRATTMTTL